MKRFNILLIAFLTVYGVFGQNKTATKAFELFGTSFSMETRVMDIDETEKVYGNLKQGDSVTMTVKGQVKNVCRAKGCWMTLDLDENNEVLVKFKNYGFFVPTNLNENEVIFSGKAFVEEISIDEQRHYAKDAGKSAEEVSNITMPKRALRFEATGVLVGE